MTEKNRVEVIIDGKDFTIVSDEEEAYIKELASYLDSKIRSLASRNKKLSEIMSVTLAGLHITDELYKLDQQSKKEATSLEELSSNYKEKNKELDQIIQQYQAEIEEKELALEEIEKELEIIKDKNYNCQLELIDAKKELADYLSLLDRETSIK